MGLPDKEIKVENIYIYGFAGESIKVKGTIRLLVTLGSSVSSTTQIADFMVVDQESFHNSLVGRPILKGMRVVTSIYHLSMNFPTSGGIGCVTGCQYDSRDCYNKSVKGFQKRSGLEIEEVIEDVEKSKNMRRDVNALYIVQFPENEELEEQPVHGSIPSTGQLLGEPEGITGLDVEHLEVMPCEEESELMKVDKGKLVVKELYP